VVEERNLLFTVMRGIATEAELEYDRVNTVNKEVGK